MIPHVISHKIICENQCTMTKLNYEILLTNKSLNNYIDYCLTTSNYNPMVILFAIASGVVVLNSWKFNCVEVENWKT
jgi:hypothetical protein